jgi:hypothetical protein
MSSTMPEDVICFSCGRVISGASGAKARGGREFRGSSTRGAKGKETAKMAAAQASGPRPRRGGGVAQAGIRHARKSSMKNLFLVGVVSFVFLFTPAQDQFVEMVSDLEAEVMNQFKPGRQYPLEASYTYSRTYTIAEDNEPSTGGLPGGQIVFKRQMSIPFDRTSKSVMTEHFAAESDSGPFSAEKLQDIISVKVLTEGQTIVIPLDGTARSRASAVTLASGNLVYWPVENSGEDSCAHTRCIIWEGTVSDGDSSTLKVQVEVEGKSWSWWQDSSVNSDISGKSWGINVDNSGTFSDTQSRAGGTYWNDYGKNSQWYYSSFRKVYLINGDDPLIQQTALDISASLPDGLGDNAYAFARAAFDFLVEKITYNPDADINPISGSMCIESETGDCDEVSNAWMSLLRVKEIPTWYEFGILLNPYNEKWEGHAWANVMLPLSESWCASKGITIESCYILGEVDVVNNKWLLHTPTAVTDWIEVPDPTGNLIDSAYRGWSFSISDGGRAMYASEIDTVGSVEYIGGTYVVTVDPESF